MQVEDTGKSLEVDITNRDAIRAALPKVSERIAEAEARACTAAARVRHFERLVSLLNAQASRSLSLSSQESSNT